MKKAEPDKKNLDVARYPNTQDNSITYMMYPLKIPNIEKNNVALFKFWYIIGTIVHRDFRCIIYYIIILTIDI